MKKQSISRLIKMLALVLGVWECSVHAQVTNFANFTPVRFTMERRDAPDSVEQGVFVSFSSDVGRIYRLESSTTLLSNDWSVVEQVIGDTTNMSFWIPIMNMTVIGAGSTNGGNTNPPPGFNGAMMASGDGLSIENTSPYPPLPYPWEPYYHPGTANKSRPTLSSGSVNSAESSESLSSLESIAKFYRVVCPEDRIQFPEFDPFTEQYLYFDVWTSISGKYTIKLFSDSTLVYSNTANVPANGRFGVHDGNYDPNDWPYTGFYAGNEFRLEVSVTNTAVSFAQDNPATAVAKKKIRRRNYNRVGVTAQQDGAIGTLTLSEQQYFDAYWETYYLACYQGAQQVDLDYTLLNEFETEASIPKLRNTNDWIKLRGLIYGTNLSTFITDFHYFGHGNVNGIGQNAAFMHVALGPLQASAVLKKNPMSYAFLDGCKSAENTDLLKSMVGYGKKVNRNTMMSKGMTPGFAAGWTKKANIGYVNQGTLRYKHFDWVTDYYTKLTQRNGGNLLFRTFQEAITFALHPNGGGVDPSVTDNDEGNTLDWVGCFDCIFDEFGSP
ncbi:MAG TPA: hypothetical protein VGF13_19045 [Verrucomicrobiae bacterium]|jgi:hypothetical protein